MASPPRNTGLRTIQLAEKEYERLLQIPAIATYLESYGDTTSRDASSHLLISYDPEVAERFAAREGMNDIKLRLPGEAEANVVKCLLNVGIIHFERGFEHGVASVAEA